MHFSLAKVKRDGSRPFCGSATLEEAISKQGPSLYKIGLD
jgi:hypothetical protein